MVTNPIIHANVDERTNAAVQEVSDIVVSRTIPIHVAAKFEPDRVRAGREVRRLKGVIDANELANFRSVQI